MIVLLFLVLFSCNESKKKLVSSTYVIIDMVANDLICPALILNAFLKITCKEKCQVSYPNKDNKAKILDFIFPPKTFYSLKDSKKTWDEEKKIKVEFQGSLI